MFRECEHLIYCSNQCIVKDFIQVSREDCSQCELHTEKNEQVQMRSPAFNPCIHLGSKRKCCSSLFICRKFKADCVKLLASQSEGLLCCETCDSYESPGITS